MDEEEPLYITSALYKALQLARASNYFPLLVQAAAAIEGRDYSDRLLVWVASRPTVTTAIPITIGEDGSPSAVDPTLEDLMVQAGDAVDAVILAAVSAYPGGQ